MDGAACCGAKNTVGAASELEGVGGAEVIVIGDALGESRGKLALGGDVGRAFEFLLDAVGDGDFAGEDLEARKLLVGLAGDLLQVLVAGAKLLGFQAEGIR